MRASTGGSLLGRLPASKVVLAALSCALAGPLALNTHAQMMTPGMSQPQLVWVDTDIGDDIDDAFALGLILRSPSCTWLGSRLHSGIRKCGLGWWIV